MVRRDRAQDAADTRNGCHSSPSRGTQFMAAAFSAWLGVMAAPSPGGDIRRHRTARLLTVLLVLLFVVSALAEPPVRRQAPHDLELELHARRAIQKDKTLALYNLFVRVEQGVVTVS